MTTKGVAHASTKVAAPVKAKRRSVSRAVGQDKPAVPASATRVRRAAKSAAGTQDKPGNNPRNTRAASKPRVAIAVQEASDTDPVTFDSASRAIKQLGKTARRAGASEFERR